MKKAEEYKIGFFWLFRFLLIVSGVLAFYRGNWTNFTLAVVALFFMFLPSIIEQEMQFDLPNAGEVIVVLFIFSSLYLGEIQMFYERFWWWDVMLHGFAGVIIAIIGFNLIYILNKKKRINLSPLFLSLFSFSLSLAFGALWEILEFSLDSFFGFHTQNGSLIDTMWDLILDALGALAISCFGYLYLKNKIKVVLIKKYTQEIIKNNKDFFE